MHAPAGPKHISTVSNHQPSSNMADASHEDKHSHLPEGKPVVFSRNREFEGSQYKIVCGPLLRYWGLEKNTWKGSVMYVFEDPESNQHAPLKFIVNGQVSKPIKLYTKYEYSWVRFDFEIPLQAHGQAVEYVLENEHYPFTFYVPGTEDEANILFFSCNGFSVSTPTAEFPNSLWSDVMAKHRENPYNYALGGGDQLYCDSISLYLPVFKKWTHHNLDRRGFRYTPNDKDKEGMEYYYIKSYIQWFGAGYWKGTNGETVQKELPDALATIPALNIYDDHDIIDGFGSYKDKTQRTPMFMQVCDSAQRYYLLFQQMISPDEKSADPKREDKSWLMTGRKGPYMPYPARSIWAQLGKSVQFCGLDCRTERTQNTIVASDTYDLFFMRAEQELSNPETKHFLLMLGVPIAYPRMVWAEALMSSALLKPVKWLARHKIILSGFVNEFDGQVELLDDLSDHWCAAPHKQERNKFVQRLQALAEKTNTRVTILAGDVHLCGVGRFRSKTPTKAEQDPRLIVCPISSAITNTPPPALLADFMNKRNKNHYLSDHTVEDMVPIFKNDTDGSDRNNNCTLARRNYCNLFVKPDGSMDMNLQVEKDNKGPGPETVRYTEVIPGLHLGEGAEATTAKAAAQAAHQGSA